MSAPTIIEWGEGPAAPPTDPLAAWRHRAACQQADPDMFFPSQNDHTTGVAAKEVCALCPVVEECLTWALDNNEEHGVWGGTTPRERRTLRRLGGSR